MTDKPAVNDGNNSLRKVIEVGGVKMEVDLRYVKVIEAYKVGDMIKMLKKEGYGSTYKSYPGIIVGFDNFQKQPAIIVAWFSGSSYSEPKINFETITALSEDVEICPMVLDEIPFKQADALQWFDTEIQKKEKELQDMRMKRQYFLEAFGSAIKRAEERLVDVTEVK